MAWQSSGVNNAEMVDKLTRKFSFLMIAWPDFCSALSVLFHCATYIVCSEKTAIYSDMSHHSNPNPNPFATVHHHQASVSFRVSMWRMAFDEWIESSSSHGYAQTQHHITTHFTFNYLKVLHSLLRPMYTGK